MFFFYFGQSHVTLSPVNRPLLVCALRCSSEPHGAVYQLHQAALRAPAAQHRWLCGLRQEKRNMRQRRGLDLKYEPPWRGGCLGWFFFPLSGFLIQRGSVLRISAFSFLGTVEVINARETVPQDVPHNLLSSCAAPPLGKDTDCGKQCTKLRVGKLRPC